MPAPPIARPIIAGIGPITTGGLMARAVSLVSVPILTRLLAPADYGVAALAATIVALLSVVAIRGLDLGYVRYASVPGTSRFAAVERHVWISALKGAVVCSIAGALLWACVLADAFHAPRSLGSMIGIGVFLSVVAVMARSAAQLRRAYGRLAAAAVAGALSSLLATLALALSGVPGAWALTAGASVGFAATAWLPLRGIERMVARGAGRKLADEERRDIARISFTGWTLAPLYWVISSADRWLLGSMRTATDVGIYSLAASVASVGLVLNDAVVATWFPEISRGPQSPRSDSPEVLGREWLRVASFLAVAWLALAAGGGDAIRALADSRFHGAAPLVPWLALGVVLYGMATLANTAPWLASDLRPTVAWWAIGTCVNLVLNVASIPSLGPLGSALASSGGFAVTAIGLQWAGQHRMRLAIDWPRLAAIAGIMAVGGVLLARPWCANPWLSLLFKLPIGTLLGVACLEVGSSGSVRKSGDIVREWFSRQRFPR